MWQGINISKKSWEHDTFRQKFTGFCTPKYGTPQPVLPYLQNWRLSIQSWLLKFCFYDPMSTLGRRVPVNQVERIVSVHLWSFFYGGSKLIFFKHYMNKFVSIKPKMLVRCFDPLPMVQL